MSVSAERRCRCGHIESIHAVMPKACGARVVTNTGRIDRCSCYRFVPLAER